MSYNDYERGRQGGCIPDGLEYGSDAYISALRGVQDRDEENANAHGKILMEAQTLSGHVPVRFNNEQGVRGLGLIVLVAVVFGFGVLFSVTERWSEYPYPYKIVALFYHVIITLPITGFAWIWEMVIHNLFDGYSLWSVPVTLAVEFAYFLILVMLAVLLYELMKRLRISLSILLVPAAFALMWYLGEKFV